MRDVERRIGREPTATENAARRTPEPAALVRLASVVGNTTFTRMVSSGGTLARRKDKSTTHSLIKGHRESPYETRHGPRPPSPEPGGRREGTRLYEQQRRAKEEGASEPAAPPPPPVPEDGLIRVPEGNGVFFSGRRNELHFRDYDTLLKTLGDPIPDTAHRNRPLYRCQKQRLPRKADRIGKEDYCDIDHIQNQYEWILKHGRMTTHMLADGHSYTAITLSEAVDRYNDTKNLQLMSKKKNRGKKTGPKTFDRDMDMLHDSSTCDCCKRLSAGPPKKRDRGGGDGSSGFDTSAPMAVS